MRAKPWLPGRVAAAQANCGAWVFRHRAVEVGQIFKGGQAGGSNWSPVRRPATDMRRRKVWAGTGGSAMAAADRRQGPNAFACWRQAGAPMQAAAGRAGARMAANPRTTPAPSTRPQNVMGTSAVASRAMERSKGTKAR